MPVLSISGAGSGVDWRSMVDAIMDVERLPISRWNQRQETLGIVKSAWMALRTGLATLDSRLEALNQSSIFNAKALTVSNNQVLTASADSTATVGEYHIAVIQRALAHVIASDQFDPSAALGLSGTFEINGKAVTIDGGDSLDAIASKVNGASVGASASVIDGRLILKSLVTGEENSLKLAGDLEILEGLGVLVGGQIKNELVEARDALFQVDGLDIQRPSNTISDVLPGVTFVLRAEGATTLTIESDQSHAMETIKGVVDAYNSFMSKVALEKGEAGILRGDPFLLRIEGSLRTPLISRLEGEGPYKTLADIGIETKARSTTLTLNEKLLKEALRADPDAVKALFYSPTEQGQGVAERLRTGIDTFIDNQTGSIVGREKQIGDTIRDLKRRVESLETRLEKREENLVKRFIAMEKALSQLQAQSEWMNQWILNATAKRRGS